MKYALSLNNDNRILSACIVLPIGNYEKMPIVDNLPDENIVDYLYIDGQYVHEPLPQEPAIKLEPTADEVLNTLLGVGGGRNE